MSAPAPLNTPHKGRSDVDNQDGSIMGSIAALRNILMIDAPTNKMLSEKHTSITLQQSRYEERTKYQEQISKLASTVADLETKLEQVQQESQKEASMRKTLETTYGALTQHKKELAMQLELVSKSRESVEGKLTTANQTRQTEKASFERQRLAWQPHLDQMKRDCDKALKKSGEWEAKCLTSQRPTEELQAELATLQTELTTTKAQHEETLRSYVNTQESLLLKQRLKDSEMARTKSEEEVSLAFRCYTIF